MGEISFGGLSTGLPTDDIIKSLMKVERIPLDKLNTAKEKEAEKLKAYKEVDTLLETLRSTVSSMNDTSEARNTAAKVNDDDLITATSTGAATGSYQIAVEQLAQVQKTITNGVSSRTDKIFGEGSLEIGDTTITIDESNNSLGGMMEAINAQSEKTGVVANIINDGSGTDNFHLVLTGKDASTTFDFKTTGLDINFDNTTEDGGANNTTEAQQAIAYVDGVKIVSDNNTLKDTLPGLSIDLKSVSETKDNKLVATTLTVEPDNDALKKNITDFVAAYNDIMDWIVAGYQEETKDTSKSTDDKTDDKDDSKTKSTDNTLNRLLRGDSSLLKVKRELQGILGSPVDSSSAYNILSEIGVETKQDGTLNVNDSKLDEAIENNFDEVVNLMAGSSTEDGVMDKFNTLLVQKTSSTKGMYAQKEDSHDSSIKSLDKQVERREAMLKSVEARYRSQFVALEKIVSGMKSQSEFLTSFFAKK